MKPREDKLKQLIDKENQLKRELEDTINKESGLVSSLQSFLQSIETQKKFLAEIKKAGQLSSASSKRWNRLLNFIKEFENYKIKLQNFQKQIRDLHYEYGKAIVATNLERTEISRQTNTTAPQLQKGETTLKKSQAIFAEIAQCLKEISDKEAEIRKLFKEAKNIENELANKKTAITTASKVLASKARSAVEINTPPVTAARQDAEKIAKLAKEINQFNQFKGNFKQHIRRAKSILAQKESQERKIALEALYLNHLWEFSTLINTYQRNVDSLSNLKAIVETHPTAENRAKLEELSVTFANTNTDIVNFLREGEDVVRKVKIEIGIPSTEKSRKDGNLFLSTQNTYDNFKTRLKNLIVKANELNNMFPTPEYYRNLKEFVEYFALFKDSYYQALKNEQYPAKEFESIKELEKDVLSLEIFLISAVNTLTKKPAFTSPKSGDQETKTDKALTILKDKWVETKNQRIVLNDDIKELKNKLDKSKSLPSNNLAKNYQELSDYLEKLKTNYSLVKVTATAGVNERDLAAEINQSYQTILSEINNTQNLLKSMEDDMLSIYPRLFSEKTYLSSEGDKGRPSDAELSVKRRDDKEPRSKKNPYQVVSKAAFKLTGPYAREKEGPNLTIEIFKEVTESAKNVEDSIVATFPKHIIPITHKDNPPYFTATIDTPIPDLLFSTHELIKQYTDQDFDYIYHKDDEKILIKDVRGVEEPNPIHMNEVRIQDLRYLRGMLLIIENLSDETLKKSLLTEVLQQFNEHQGKVKNLGANKAAFATKKLTGEFAHLLETRLNITKKESFASVTMARDLGTLLETHASIMTFSFPGKKSTATIEKSKLVHISREYYEKQIYSAANEALDDNKAWYKDATHKAGLTDLQDNWLRNFFNRHKEDLITQGVPTPSSSRWLPLPSANQLVQTIHYAHEEGKKETYRATHFVRMGVTTAHGISDPATQEDLAVRQIVEMIKANLAEAISNYTTLYGKPPKDFYINYQTLLTPHYLEGYLPYKDNNTQFVKMAKRAVATAEKEIKANLDAQALPGVPNTVNLIALHTNNGINKRANWISAKLYQEDMQTRYTKINATLKVLDDYLDGPNKLKNIAALDNIANLNHYIRLLQNHTELQKNPALLDELTQRLTASYRLLQAMQNKPPYNEVEQTYQLHIMLAALEHLAMGNQTFTMAGCKSARDRTSIFAAAVKTMQESPHTMYDIDALNKGIFKSLYEGHHFRSMVHHSAIVKLAAVHKFFFKNLREAVREAIAAQKIFSKVTEAIKPAEDKKQKAIDSKEIPRQVFTKKAGPLSLPTLGDEKSSDLSTPQEIEPGKAAKVKVRPTTSRDDQFEKINKELASSLSKLKNCLEEIKEVLQETPKATEKTEKEAAPKPPESTKSSSVSFMLHPPYETPKLSGANFMFYHHDNGKTKLSGNKEASHKPKNQKSKAND